MPRLIGSNPGTKFGSYCKLITFRQGKKPVVLTCPFSIVLTLEQHVVQIVSEPILIQGNNTIQLFDHKFYFLICSHRGTEYGPDYKRANSTQ